MLLKDTAYPRFNWRLHIRVEGDEAGAGPKTCTEHGAENNIFMQMPIY